MDYDEIFDIMGNDVRRKILRCLAQEPMSIGRLEKLTEVSRQAVLKHLKDLEQRGFIETEEAKKPEKAPGPSPYLYKLKQTFVIRFDLGPASLIPKFITFNVDLPEVRSEELEDDTYVQPKVSIKEKVTELLAINKQLEEITGTYRQIYSKKNELLHGLKNMIYRAIPGDAEREVLDLLINNPEKAMVGFTLQEISDELEIREDFMKFILDNLIRVGIVKDDPDGRYYLH